MAMEHSELRQRRPNVARANEPYAHRSGHGHKKKLNISIKREKESDQGRQVVRNRPGLLSLPSLSLSISTLFPLFNFNLNLILNPSTKTLSVCSVLSIISNVSDFDPKTRLRRLSQSLFSLTSIYFNSRRDILFDFVHSEPLVTSVAD